MDLTTAEVTALFDLDERQVRKDVEYGVFEHMKSRPRFALAEAVYLYTTRRVAFELVLEQRKTLYRLIAKALAANQSEVELGAHIVMKLDVSVHDVKVRLGEFDAWKKTLVQRADVTGGEPVFPMSRLAVRHVGEMARRGATFEEIVADYPYLNEKDVEFAKFYAAAYPRVGRPRAGETSPR